MAAGSAGKRLLIIRHAQAEGFGASDHDRVLTDEGRRNAESLGGWLSDNGFVPDAAVVSTAVRAEQTWSQIAARLPQQPQHQARAELYTAGPDAAIEVLSEADDEQHTLAYVGHNPTAAYLVQMLDDGNPDTAAFDELTRGYPPATVTVLEYDGSWADLAPDTARIAAVHVGGR